MPVVVLIIILHVHNVLLLIPSNCFIASCCKKNKNTATKSTSAEKTDSNELDKLDSNSKSLYNLLFKYLSESFKKLESKLNNNVDSVNDKISDMQDRIESVESNFMDTIAEIRDEN